MAWIGNVGGDCEVRGTEQSAFTYGGATERGISV